MKILLRLLKWAVLSIILQLLLLWILNSFYSPERGKYVEVTRYIATGDENKIGSIALPQNAHSIKISSDGKFAGYISEGRLNIASADKGGRDKTIDREGISFFKWLYDRNMVIYASSINGNGTCDIRVDTYEVQTGVVRSYPYITGLPSGSSAINIELSPLTNMVYVEVGINDIEKKIFKYNIIDNLEFVSQESRGTILKAFNYRDGIIYGRDALHIEIMDGNEEKSREILLERKSVLLNVAADDTVYMGECGEEGRVERIYWGSVNDRILEMKGELIFKNPIDPLEIFITNKGKMYEIDVLRRVVYDLESDAEYLYKGDLCEITDRYLTAVEDNYLNIRPLNSHN